MHGDDRLAHDARGLSARMRLELAFLDGDHADPAPRFPALGERSGRTVLVVAAECDLRRYVRECLRERAELRVVDAATVADAVALAGRLRPELLVVDEPERDVISALASPRVVLLVDDLPRDAPAIATRLRLLARPFTARELVAEIDQLVG